MKDRSEELPQASHKPGHSANTSPKSSGLPVGTTRGNLLTVNMNFFCISASRRPRARWHYLVRKEPNTTAGWATGQRRGRQPRAQTRLPFPVPKGHQEQFSSFSSQQGSRQTCQLHANALRQHPEVQLSQFSPGTGAQLLKHNKPQQRR